jgi:RNA polymerase sigma factor (sigma-70 family)
MENVLADRMPLRLRRPARLLRLASDERLVALVRDGEEGAFEALYDRHHPAILGFCRHMLGTREEAEDAVQHTFLAAFRDLARHEKPVELRPWLFAIARNRCLSLLRARRAHVAIELAEPATDGLAATVERREDLRELLSDLASLPEDQRAALLLAELGALDHAGIATVLGCPREKVKALVFQARTSLAASREARATPCDEIRLELAGASGAALRRGPLRRHLRTCDGCRAFKAEVATQRKLLALALPVIPSVALKGSVLSGTGIASTSGGGTAAVASATTAGAAGATSGASGGVLGGVLGTVASTGAGKVAVSLAVAGAVAGGGSALSERLEHRSSAAPASSPGTLAPGAGQSIVPPPFASGRDRAGRARSGGDASAPPPAHAPGGSGDPSAGTPAPAPPGAGTPHESTGPRSGHGPVQAEHRPSHPAPPSHAGGGGTVAPDHGGPPPGQQGSSPGEAHGSDPGVVPPGHGGTPPGQSGGSAVAPKQSKPLAPSGQAKASTSGPPGLSRAPATPPGPPAAPPGLDRAPATPPGPPAAPPGQTGAASPPARAAPSVGGPPAGAGSPPQAPPSTPPGQAGASHGQAGGTPASAGAAPGMSGAPGQSGAARGNGR